MAVPAGAALDGVQAFATARADARAGRPEAARAVAREFEGIFVRMMLQSMRATEFDDTLSGGAGGDLYRDMFDQKIAAQMGAGGRLGIAAILERQLGGTPEGAGPGDGMKFVPRYWSGDAQMPAATGPWGARVESLRGATGPTRPGAVPEAPAARPAAGEQAAQGGGESRTLSDYVAAVEPHARAAARKLGTSADVLVAQSALETGWGRKVIRRPDGSPSYNMFGIKADASWKGDRVRVPTIEYVDGVATREYAEFRAYGSLAEGFEDYAQFLRENPRYDGALARSQDPAAYIHGLQRAGYATDPRYATKVLSIMERIGDAPPVLLAQAY